MTFFVGFMVGGFCGVLLMAIVNANRFGGD